MLCPPPCIRCWLWLANPRYIPLGQMGCDRGQRMSIAPTRSPGLPVLDGAGPNPLVILRVIPPQ